LVLCGKEITRVRLESHDATGHTPVACLVVQQCQHGLMTPMHTVKVANGQGACLGQLRVLKTSEDAHH
jgi:hypothetical protein